MNVYLCSRVAYDARPLNNIVAASLRNAGFTVYVPHEQAPNNLSKEDMEQGRFDKETIFKLDFQAMNNADMCVVVGRIGRDCGWELGWFYAQKVPIYHVPGTDNTWETSPMIIPCLTEAPKYLQNELNEHPDKVGSLLQHCMLRGSKDKIWEVK